MMLASRIESLIASDALSVVRTPELLATSGRAIATVGTPSKWASVYLRSPGGGWIEAFAVELIREDGYRLKLFDLFSVLAPGGEYVMAPGDEIGVGCSPSLAGNDFASVRISYETVETEAETLATMETSLAALNGKIDQLMATANAIASSSVETAVIVGTTSGTAIAANSNRLSAIFTNTSTATIYLRTGPEDASPALYSYPLEPGQLVELATKESVQAIATESANLIISEQIA